MQKQIQEHISKVQKKRRTYLRKNKKVQKFSISKDFYILGFFGFILGIVCLRLFYLQVIKANYYEQEISQIHYKENTLKAQRGHIYVMDKVGRPIKLTENIAVYDLFVEPQHLENDQNKTKFIEAIAPLLYKHLCVERIVKETTPETCVQSLEAFTNKKLLPEMPELFYLGSGILSESYETFSSTGYQEQFDSVVDSMTEEIAIKLITERLEQRINIGIRESNYLGFYEHPGLLTQLAAMPGVAVYNNYVYIEPASIRDKNQSANSINKIFEYYGYQSLRDTIRNQMEPKEHTYVKIASELHPSIAAEIKELKAEYKEGFSQCFSQYLTETPLQESCDKHRGDWPDISEAKSLLHGLGLEEYYIRHYPYDNFLSHVLGYVNRSSIPTYGIEEYMNASLRGKDGKIIGRSSSFIGDIGANEFAIEQAIDGDDIYLTIDPTIQKEISQIAEEHRVLFNADSVSVTVLNPFNGQVAALVNAPTFNPNQFNDAFQYVPLTPEYGYLLDQESYTDIHVYIKDEDGSFRKATTDERADTSLEKYMTKNVFSSEVFVDKNIKYAYEPGSIIKAMTVAIGIDADEINLFDFYEDKGFVKVGPYTIANVADQCLGENSYLNAFVYSCNVGMVRIVQAVGKEIYYNYIKQLGFGRKTGIELAGEEEGFVGHSTTVSLARFLNNSFGLGMRATPLQVAVAYGTLLNGGYLVKPTIIAKTQEQATGEEKENPVTIVRRVFKEYTATELQSALFDVIHQNKQNRRNTAVEGFALGGKSGTSEITYKGQYIGSAGWTNGSFVGMITQENPKYVIVVQVRRPRTNKWGTETAGKIFKEVAEFIIGYELIPE